MSKTLISDLDTCTDAAELYCGNCGLDYAGLTVDGLEEICGRRGCPACRQYLEGLQDEIEHHCAYCEAQISDPDEVPGIDDDAAWEGLENEHHDGCEWCETRAHRVGVE